MCIALRDSQMFVACGVSKIWNENKNKWRNKKNQNKNYDDKYIYIFVCNWKRKIKKETKSYIVDNRDEQISKMNTYTLNNNQHFFFIVARSVCHFFVFVFVFFPLKCYKNEENEN